MSKVWFITGSSRGLGRELVRAALDTGDALAATARRGITLRHKYDDVGLPYAKTMASPWPSST